MNTKVLKKAQKIIRKVFFTKSLHFSVKNPGAFSNNKFNCINVIPPKKHGESTEQLVILIELKI